MTIKYPVRWEEGGGDEYGIIFIGDAMSHEIARIDLDFHKDRDDAIKSAEIIVNALNAMNEFPELDYPTSSIRDWYNKYIISRIDKAWSNAFEKLNLKR